MIQNVDRIARAAGNAGIILTGENSENVLDMILSCEEELGGITDVSAETGELLERLTAARIELSDISDELNRIEDSLDIDERRFDYITNRYNKINMAMKNITADLRSFSSF